jgi:uncharacterized protein (TIGR04255 family)
MDKGESQSLPDYKRPPVIEVVCGIVFETIESFRGHHLGLFWQKVQDEFPTCEHAARLGFDPKSLDLTKYLPRVWFVSEQQNTLIQLQDDRFLFNWRKIQQEEAYPRYSTIIEAFKANLGIFQEFLEEEDMVSVNPNTCELTYINHIPKGEGWESLSDINEVFRDFAWDSNERFLPKPLGLGGQVVFPLPRDKGRLNITLQHGERKFDKCPILILQISARGLGGNKSMDTVWEWFEVAHEWIVCGFADLTGTTIQKDVWQRIDAT